MDFFESTNDFYLVYLQERNEMDSDPLGLYYTKYAQSDPLKSIETGNISLSFLPAMIRSFKCEAPIYSLTAVSGDFTCYFGLVNGSLVRVSFVRGSDSSHFVSAEQFEFFKYKNGWVNEIRVFDKFVSIYSRMDQNFTIVNYAKNETSKFLHSIKQTGSKKLDFFIDGITLTSQSEYSPTNLRNSKLHNAYLTFPNKLAGVNDLQSVSLVINAGEARVMLLDLLSNAKQSNSLFLIIFLVFLVLISVFGVVACRQVFKSKEVHPDLLDKSEASEKVRKNSRQERFEKERKKELERDLQKSFTQRGEDTQDDIDNMV